MHPSKLAQLVGLALVVLAGCASAPGEEQSIRSMPPAACRLAVGVSQGPAQGASAAGLRFTQDAAALRDAVVAQLADLNAASSVLAVADADDAAAKGADVFLDLRVVGSAPPSHSGVSSGWWSSGVLWLVTWIGGLLTDDSTYQTNLKLSGTLSHVGSEDIGSVVAESGAVDLSYWERNTVASWRFLQSLVLPPFWTTDDPEITSAALTERATAAACVRIADYVKRELEDDSAERLARFTLKQPAANAVEVDQASTMLEFVIESRSSPVALLALERDGVRTELPLPPDTGMAGSYVCAVPARPIELQRGANEVRVIAVIGGRRFTRTLVIQRKDDAD
jgi:hypothetical protein